MPLSVDQFAKALVTTGLSSPAEIKALWNAIPAGERPRDGESLAKFLIEQQKLNTFQASEILSGKTTPLVLGDYMLLSRIGAGGMGQVFQAQHRHMDRLVAIKLLPEALTKDAAAVQRFQREVKAAAKLVHPNIVQAYDASVQRGVWYLVMEYVAGRDLAGIVQTNGPLPIARTVDFICQAARGLAFAHENGVVHRDVKPANLLLDKKGTVKILDMGLARIDDGLAAQEGLTQSGVVMGTIDYMAPEQAFDTHTADGRADIYSLGCTLFRLLTNKNLYDGDTLVKKLMAHQNQPIPSLAVQRADVPAPLVAIFERMVAKKPEDRYQTMAEVEAELAALFGRSASENPRSATSPIFPPQAATNGASQNATGIEPTIQWGAVAAAVDQAQPSAAGISPTISLSQPLQATDPVSARSIQVARDSTSTSSLPSASASTKRRPLKWIAAGLGGVALLLFAAWSLIVNRDVARVSVPEGGSAAIVSGNVPASQNTGWQGWPADAPKPAIAPFSAEQARKHQDEWAAYLKVPREWENSIGMKFVLIPPGEFMMGSTAAEIEAALKDVSPDNKHWQECIKSEAPQHKVILTQPIYLGVNEVTQAEYEKVMGVNPSHFAPMGAGKEYVAAMETANHPVEMVSWNDAAEFCAKLSQQEKFKPFYFRSGDTITPLDGTGYQLPSEAEWEFACRAGNTTKFWIGDKDEDLMRAGWFGGNSDARTHATGELKANPYGLYDIHGNVWEWVQDGWDADFYSQFQEQPAINPHSPFSAGSECVVRCGYWYYPASGCRSSARNANDPARRGNGVGFRVSMPVDAVKAALVEGTDVAEFSSHGWPSDAPKPAIAPFSADQARKHQDEWAAYLKTERVKPNSVGMQMALIPPGEFMMGSSDEDVALAIKIAEETKSDAGGVQRIQDERPQHLVRISKPFRLGIHEVTIGQFEKFIEQSGYMTQAEAFGGNSDAMKADDPRVTPESKKINWRTPGYEVGENSPVTQVSWNDAAAFCNWLSEQEKLTPSYVRDGASWALAAQPQGYRLLTEVEWEYACRAGTTTQYSFGDDWKEFDKFGWSNMNADGRSRGVGLLPANPFGLHDMHGNVWEWCHDWYDGKWYTRSPGDDPTGPLRASGRVYRGGGGDLAPAYGRSAYRDSNNGAPAYRYNARGFRVALSVTHRSPE